MSAADDRAGVMVTIQKYADATMRDDADAMFELLADDWRDHKGTTRQEIRDSWKKNAGAEVDLTDMEVTIEAGEATCRNVVVLWPHWTMTSDHRLRKEADGSWLLVHSATTDWANVRMELEERRDKLQMDDAAEAARMVREKLLSDPSRPGYHFVMPEGIAIPFDPNGAIFWKGRYHLFYIFQDKRTGRKSDHWGHVSSTDLFHWRHHPTGLLEGMYSGNCFLNKDGVPTMCYHQVGQGNAMAVALDDDLNEWQKLESNPITPKTEEGDEHHDKYRSWDPFGWYENDAYYAIFGGKHPGIAKSPTLDGEWQYVGDLFAHGVDGVALDEDVSCAELFKFGNKDMLLCISHRLGARYYLGEWKDEQFYPDFHAQMSWVDNTFFAPESMLDDQGRRIMWAWLLDFREIGVRWEHGWSGVMCLPRVLSMNDDGEVLMDVAAEIELLRYGANSEKDIAVPADTDVPVEGVSGDSFELIVEMESSDATQYGVKVYQSPDGEEETVIYYDAEDGALKIDTNRSGPDDTPKDIEAGPLRLKEGERLTLRIFVDKSVIEVFANSRQAVMRRVYPSRPDSVGVSLFSKGGTAQLHSLQSWLISPSNPY
ncbi:MAG: GH32 C-terminal domain-containing protein [Woeseiaceae bacterium]